PAKTAAVRLTIPHAKLALLHPAYIADIVEEMTADERIAVFQQLDLETAAEALQEVEPEMQAAIVSDLPEERAADILEEMDPDEAADLLQDLPEERREELVDLMQKEEAQDVEELLTYPEDSAGGIMTSDFLALPAEITAAQAIDLLREKKPDPALTYYLYVVDPQEKLEGVLSLRDLVVAPPETKVTAIMDPNILKVSARLALATGQGLAGLIRERFGVRWTAFAVLTMLVANFGTTVAEFAGVAAALGVFGVSADLAAVMAAAIVVILLARGSFSRIQYAFVAIGAGVSIAYAVSASLANPDWGHAARAVGIPEITWTGAYCLTPVGVVGTP